MTGSLTNLMLPATTAAEHPGIRIRVCLRNSVATSQASDCIVIDTVRHAPRTNVKCGIASV